MSERELLQQWVEAEKNFDECLRPEDVELCRGLRLAALQGDSQFKVLKNGESFLAWDLSATEEDTGSPLAFLWARSGELSEQTKLLEQSKEELKALPFVASSFHSDPEWAQRLQEAGFYPLRHFVTKVMKPQSVEQTLSMRVGEVRDKPFFTALAASVASHTLPPHRDKELASYRSALLRRLLKLDYGPKSDYELWIAEDDQGSVGYLLLRTDSHKRAWVVDIGVQKSHWGQGVAQFTVLSAENMLLERGFEFYVGEISAANERSLFVSTKLCGFDRNRLLWRRDPD